MIGLMSVHREQKTILKKKLSKFIIWDLWNHEQIRTG